MQLFRDANIHATATPKLVPPFPHAVRNNIAALRTEKRGTNLQHETMMVDEYDPPLVTKLFSQYQRKKSRSFSQHNVRQKLPKENGYALAWLNRTR
jgi:hypothetical protein